MKWLLDTNAVSELSKPAPAVELVNWLAANESDTALSAVTIGEIVGGVERLPEGKKRRRLERALRFLREDYADRILDFTEGAAVEWGRLVAEASKQGRKLSVLDSQIEATAIYYGLIVATRNGEDFFHPVLDPWEQPPLL